MSKPFWESKSLFEMTRQEWESVCDGCAKCCLLQLQGVDNNDLVFTNVACDLLDAANCKCTKYSQRSELVPDCISMNKDNVYECAEFMPDTCAYKLLLNGEALPPWHHLICSDIQRVHLEGHSAKNKVVHAKEIDMENIETHVVDEI